MGTQVFSTDKTDRHDITENQTKNHNANTSTEQYNIQKTGTSYLLGHLISPPFSSRVWVAQSLVFCVVL